jgi:hypothetical protein
MLKISVIDDSTQRRLILEGKLIAPWVAELRAAWKAAKADLQGRQLMIDMVDVNCISQEGENALLELMIEGAEFRSRGVFTKHVIQELARRSLSKAPGRSKNEAVH